MTYAAGGHSISELTANEAAQWLTLLMSGQATMEDRSALQRWRQECDDNDRAWKHIEAVTSRLKLMHSRAAYEALSPHAKAPPARSAGRRATIRVLGWGFIATAAGLFGTRLPLVQELVADQRTGTGERRTLTLDDGTRITLNTATAIDLRFNARQRTAHLLNGEILVETGHASKRGVPEHRPFIVQTSQGSIKALGTRFTVRQQEEHTAVVVLESAVEITPSANSLGVQVIQEGRRSRFTTTAVLDSLPSSASDFAWTRGQIVADNLLLAEFLADLSRYRPGILNCTPTAGRMRISGVFPLDDTDRILATLPNVLPVQVRTRTRYWVTVDSTN